MQHTFLPTTVTHIARRERSLGLLVVWRERLASATKARSTRIRINPGLTENGEGNEQPAIERIASALEKTTTGQGRTAKEAIPTVTFFPESPPSSRTGAEIQRPSQLLRLPCH
jgi:hypothetical protein